MSTTIDEKVVSLQFDNKQFESGVRTTMSTLDKLKASLNFDGATKAFDNIETASSKVSMSGMSDALETVRMKFSALEVMAITALANITNSAIQAGTQLVKSLSVDQVMAGWSKYEQKTASVQTIMNATGKTIDEVNGYLAKLMWFSDETSYGFTDMTAALGQMTASGGDIDNLIPLIMGVANATAYAGKGASEFTRAMYNLNQSYASGSLQYMDWRSLELAGIASKELKQIFIDTAVAMGKIKEGEVTIANFGQTLKDRWADTSVMEAAFGKFGEMTEGVYKLIQSGEVDTAADAIKKLSGQYSDVAEKAFKSAQEAKSFTEAIEATKDAVSSGWMKTFEIIFGNYEEAKVLWTDLCNSLWDIFASSGESRNELLEDALGSKWSTIASKVESAGIEMDDFKNKLVETGKRHNAITDQMISDSGGFNNSLKEGWLTTDIFVETLKEYAGGIADGANATADMSKTLDKFADVVSRVWRGDFGKGQERIKKLTEAGYDYATVQALVNKTVDDHVLNLEDLTDVQLEHIGYTEDEIAAIRELAKEAEKAGTPLNKLIASLEKPSGRELLVEALLNAITGIQVVLDSVKQAWNDVFPAVTAEQLYNAAERIRDLSEALIMSDDTVDKFTRTLRGLFTVLDIIRDVVGTTISRALKLFDSSIGELDIDILGFTATLGDAIVAFDDWLEANDAIQKVLDALIEALKYSIEKIIEWIEAFSELPFVRNTIDEVRERVDELRKSFEKLPTAKDIIDSLTKAFNDLKSGIIGGKTITEWIDSFKSIPAVQTALSKLTEIVDKVKESFGGFKTVGEDSMAGLIAGLQNGATSIWNTIKSVALKMLDTIKKVLGINSPSLEFYKVGMYAISGLINGLKNGEFSIRAIIRELAGLLINVMCDALGIHSPSTIFMGIGGFLVAGLIIGILSSKPQLVEAVKEFASNITSAIKEALGIGDESGEMSEAGKKTMQDYIDGFKSKFEEVWAALKEFGKTFSEKADEYIGPALLIGAGTGVILLAKALDTAFKAVTSPISTFTAMMKSASGAFKALEMSFKATSLIKNSLAIMICAGAIAVLAGSVAVLANISDQGKLWSAVGAVAALSAVLAGFSFVFEKIGGIGFKLSGIVTITALAAAVHILVLALKQLETVNSDDVGKNLLTLGGLATGLAVIVSVMGKLTPQLSAGGVFMVAYAAAILVLVKALAEVAAISSTIDVTSVLSLMLSIMVGLALVTAASKNVKFGAAVTIVAIVAALKLMAGAIDDIAQIKMDVITDNIWAFVTVFGALSALMLVSSFSTPSSWKGGASILLMTTSLLVIAKALEKFAELDAAGNLDQSLAAIIKLLEVFGWMTVATVAAGQHAIKAGGAILLMSGAILILTGAMMVLGKIKAPELEQGMNALVTMLAMLAVVTAATGFAKPDSMKTVVALTVAIGVLALALAGLAMIDEDKLLSATVALGAILALFAVVLSTGSKLTKNVGPILSMGVIITALVGGLAILSSFDYVNVLAASGGLASVMLTLTAVFSSIKGLRSKSVEQVAILTAVVAGLAVGLAIMATQPWTNLLAAAVSLDIVLAAIVIATKHVEKVTKKTLESTTILAAITAGLGIALAVMATQPWNNLLAAAASLSVVLAAIVVATKHVEKLSKGTLDSFTILSGAMAVIGLVMTAMATQPWQNLLAASAALSVVLGTLAATLVIVAKAGKSIHSASTALLTASASFLVIAAAIAVLAPALVQLSKIELIDLGKAILALAAAFATIGAAALVLSGLTPVIIALSAALAAFGVASLALAAALVVFTSGLEVLMKIMPNATGVFNDFLNMMSKTVTTLASTIAQAIANFLSVLANNATKISAAITVILTAILTAIKINAPQIISTFTTIVTSMLNAVTTLAPQIVNTVVTLANSILNGLKQTIPSILSCLDTMITSMLNFLVSVIPKMVDSGMKIITGILTGIANNIQKVVEKGAEIVVNFIKGVTNKLPDIIDAAFKLVISFINGLADAIRNNNGNLAAAGLNLIKAIVQAVANNSGLLLTEAKNAIGKFVQGVKDKLPDVATKGREIVTNIKNAITAKANELQAKGKELIGKVSTGIKSGYTDITLKAKELINKFKTSLDNMASTIRLAGKNIVEGIIKGVKDKLTAAANVAKDLGRTIINGAKGILGIKSPSRVFAEIGRFVDEGFVQGINEYSSDVTDATESLGDKAISGMSSAIAQMSEMINTDIDTQPTIRPVLDLSNVESGASRLNTLFSRTQALSVSASMDSANSSKNQNGANAASTGNTYQFTQNNYSPKALSSIEIYRQTKNQFSTLERMATV